MNYFSKRRSFLAFLFIKKLICYLVLIYLKKFRLQWCEFLPKPILWCVNLSSTVYERERCMVEPVFKVPFPRTRSVIWLIRWPLAHAICNHVLGNSTSTSAFDKKKPSKNQIWVRRREEKKFVMKINIIFAVTEE